MLGVSVCVCIVLVFTIIAIASNTETNNNDTTRTTSSSKSFKTDKEEKEGYTHFIEYNMNQLRKVCDGWKAPVGEAKIVLYDVQERDIQIPTNWRDEKKMRDFCAPYSLVKFRVTHSMIDRNNLEVVDCDTPPLPPPPPLTSLHRRTRVCRFYPICMLPPSDDAISSHVNNTGVWEESHLSAIHNILIATGGQSNVFLLDAGVNQGIYSIWASILGYRVVGFEANPHLMPLLRRSFSLAGLSRHITLFNNALSHTRQTVQLREEKGNIGASVVQKQQQQQHRTLTPAMNQITLDDTLDLIKSRHPGMLLGYMKIDIESHEAKFFTGGADFFAYYYPRNFQMEISTVASDHSTWNSCNCELFQQTMHNLGYVRHDHFWQENVTFCQKHGTFGESVFEYIAPL